MLAAPLMPAPLVFSSTSEESSQYRPVRDREAFDQLLPPPVDFIEGSSAGALAVPPGKYEPINASPKAKPNSTASTPIKPAKRIPPSPNDSPSRFPGFIDTAWPDGCNRGSGLYNIGNTCFLNSTLQCLLHTPPLLRMLLDHKKESCRVTNEFCMSCSMKMVMKESYSTTSTFSPTVITTKLQVIAKHMRRGRQEDSHEFLRYAIDAFQKSCLAGHPQKPESAFAETTWVHRLFGGRLRSRVTCRNCGHNSDTFDRILDLSVDIHQADSLKEALQNFVAIDHLKGADKYKCEKCEKHVVAEKRFTVHDAPLVLTVHLKRFSPTGRKIGHHVQYREHLSLDPYMSDDLYGPSYSLYGVICHVGGGPNSGHYYAFVKSGDGSWWEMNDESVTMVYSPPLDKKHAYMLFYLRQQEQKLQGIVNSTMQAPKLAKNMRKKERQSDREDIGTRVIAPFIGPRLPSPCTRDDTIDSMQQKNTKNGTDPQAVSLQKKIAAVESLKNLTAYYSDNEPQLNKDDDQKPLSPPPPPATQLGVSSTLEMTDSVATKAPSSEVPPEHFYGPSKKRKINPGDTDARNRSPVHCRSNGYTSNMNPYKRLGKRPPRAV